jgi:ABC-type sugar transport system permease subunit
MLLSILLYRKAFLFSDFGGGAAVSNVLALICLGLGLLFVRMLYRPETEIGI